MTTPDLAHKTLESLRSWRKHRTTCLQCRVDKDFCRQRQVHSDIFEKRYAEWEDTQILGELNAKANIPQT